MQMLPVNMLMKLTPGRLRMYLLQSNIRESVDKFYDSMKAII